MDTHFAQRRRRDLIVAACLAAVAALVPLFVKDVYVQNIMVLTLMYAALSQSWNILSGYCGQISLGHGALMAVGGYTMASFVATCLAAAIGSFLAAQFFFAAGRLDVLVSTTVI